MEEFKFSAFDNDFLKEVVKIAKTFVGEEEISGNKGFKHKRFYDLIRACGWNVGEAWCAYFGELVYKLVVEPDIEKWSENEYIKVLDKLFSAGAVKTFNNFAGDKTKNFTISKIPVPGALAIYQTYINGNPHWTGHLCIVKELTSNVHFKTIDGNSTDGNSREGYIVAENKKVLDFDIPKTGRKLVLLGFVIPK